MLRDAILTGADAIDARSAFDPAERAAYMNASEALTCIRKQWYAKNGIAPDGPQDWGYARRGKHGERYMVECLKAANIPTLFTGEDQEQVLDDELQISCTPDGLVDGDALGIGPGWVACEFKTIDPRTNISNLPREEHVRQVQIAAAMIERAAAEFPELGGRPIIGCRLVYMNASNFNEIHEFPVPLKPRILDQLKGRASRLLKATSASRLPREGKEAGGSECRQRCSYNGACGVDGAGTSTAQGRSGGADVGQQVGTYLMAKAAEDEAKARKAEAAELIKAALKKAGVSRVEIDGHTAALTVKAGSVSYAKVVKDHCPDVDLEPYRGDPVETLTVK